MTKQRIPLADYAKSNGQAQTARALNCTQGAISRALSARREIFVLLDGEKITAEEVRRFPCERHE